MYPDSQAAGGEGERGKGGETQPAESCRTQAAAREAPEVSWMGLRAGEWGTGGMVAPILFQFKRHKQSSFGGFFSLTVFQ